MKRRRSRYPLIDRAIAAGYALLIAGIGIACATALRPVRITPRVQPWCITVVREDGEHITACTERRGTCAMARAFAATWGSQVSLAGIDAECVYEGTEQP